MKKNSMRVTNPDDLPMVLTPADIAAVMNLSRNTVYELVHSKNFPAFKIGEKLYRVRKDKFLEWLGNESVA